MKEGLIYKIINTVKEVWNEQMKQRSVKLSKLKARVVIEEQINNVEELKSKYEDYIRTSFEKETPDFDFKKAAEMKVNLSIAEKRSEQYKKAFDELFGESNNQIKNK